MTPYVTDPDFTLYVGDVLDVLAELPDESVHCCVTSPPYWGLRDYGTDGQLGLEATPEEYVARMVDVFREVRRVLRKDGTCWLNIGDSYSSNPKGQGGDAASTLTPSGTRVQRETHLTAGRVSGIKIKDLVGIPWRLAFALQADGWYLRSDIIWAKPNPMPESVTDRPTKAHEYLFLLTRSPRYFYDTDAIRERYQDGPGLTGGAYAPPGQAPHGNARGPDGRHVTRVVGADGSIQHRDGERWPNGGRNKRSVWEIATESYPDAHFATFPQALVEPCVKAGCPEQVCATCGEPRERIVERTAMVVRATPKRADWQADGDYARTQVGATMLEPPKTETVGWSNCGHDNYRPGVVLDPFMGSGTTALVARRLGRKSIGIELNPVYAELAARRLSQLSLLAGGAA